MALRRPQVLYQRSTSSSLNGMEKFIPKSSPISETSSTIIALNSINIRDKPLPPIPRRPSSAYSTHTNGISIIDSKKPENFISTSPDFLQPTSYRSSKLTAPETRLYRPELALNSDPHAASDLVDERRRAQHGDFTELNMHTSQALLLKTNLPSSSAISRTLNERANNIGEDVLMVSDRHGDNFQSVLHNQSFILPTSTPVSYYSHGSPPLPMSPRITDVVDQSLVPPPLRYSTPEEKLLEPSQFSSSSSESGSTHGSVRSSLKMFAFKTFHKQSNSHNQAEKSRVRRINSQSKNLSSSRRASRIGSTINQRRASIQKSISDMYDKPSRSSAALPKKNSTIHTASAEYSNVSRERRSPAIPITPYQKLGRKAWESSSKRSKTSRWFKFCQTESAGSKPFRDASENDRATQRFSAPVASRAPRSSSIMSRIKSAFQNNASLKEGSTTDLSRVNVKRMRSGKGKEKLKSKITVVGTEEQKCDEYDYDWL